MKLKIISDGTPKGTQIFNASTGEPLEGVHSVEWEYAVDRPTTAVIRIKGVEANLISPLD